MKKVLFVFPTMWDEIQLAACRDRFSDRFDVELGAPSDEDCAWDFDILSYIEESARRYRGAIDGVSSSSDYPGATVAAALAARLGLPGSAPADVIRCSHKFHSRAVQHAAAPEATAKYWLVNPRRLDDGGPTTFPCFVKPVKGAFSVMSGKIRSRAELAAFLSRPAASEFLRSYVAIFNRLVAEFTDFEIDGSYFIAEELLKGRLVTLEGYSVAGDVELFGVVDSIRHKGTGSFSRFEYPSTLPAAVQDQMAEIAVRVVRAFGLANTMFNIEMMYDAATGRIAIVEVNPRMCGQFADLYEKVDGVDGYEVALALAVGEPPRLRRREGDYGAAASFPLRIFAPMHVTKAPGAREIAEARSRFPGTLIWTECRTGDDLSDFESAEDGRSARYGVVNLGAPDRRQLLERREEVVRCLDYRFRPL